MLKDRDLIAKLGTLGILPTETIEDKADKDDVILDYGSYQKRVITDDISLEELNLAVAAEQLEALRSIKGMVKFFVVLAVIAIVIAVLPLLLGI